MYGLEKQQAPQRKFDFDLEIDIKKDPNKKKMLLNQIKTKAEEIKASLRTGQKAEGFEQLGILLHGYTALQRVIEKVVK